MNSIMSNSVGLIKPGTMRTSDIRLLPERVISKSKVFTVLVAMGSFTDMLFKIKPV